MDHFGWNMDGSLMKRRLAFDERDLLVLFDRSYFQFNYYMNPDHQDFNKAAAAYSMAYRIGTHCLKPHSP